MGWGEGDERRGHGEDGRRAEEPKDILLLRLLNSHGGNTTHAPAARRMPALGRSGRTARARRCAAAAGRPPDRPGSTAAQPARTPVCRGRFGVIFGEGGCVPKPKPQAEVGSRLRFPSDPKAYSLYGVYQVGAKCWHRVQPVCAPAHLVAAELGLCGGDGGGSPARGRLVSTHHQAPQQVRQLLQAWRRRGWQGRSSRRRQYGKCPDSKRSKLQPLQPFLHAQAHTHIHTLPHPHTATPHTPTPRTLTCPTRPTRSHLRPEAGQRRVRVYTHAVQPATRRAVAGASHGPHQVRHVLQ